MAAKTHRTRIVVLATGGTIAGLAADAADNIGYVAGQIGVAQLLSTLPKGVAPETELVAEQVAQVDSKDMDTAVWVRLLQRCVHHLHDTDVRGIVITHGTDTMEETAFLLHALLDGAGQLTRPLVLTGAMRPASAAMPDGPHNLADAIAVAAAGEVLAGVQVVFAGAVHAAGHVRKVHGYRLDAFESGEAGPVAWLEEGRLRRLWDGASSRPAYNWGALRPPPAALATWLEVGDAVAWPRVEIVLSHAGADGAVVQALCAASATSASALRGLVVAGTGNGTLHYGLEQALLRAQASGIRVVRCSRCAQGSVLDAGADALPHAGSLTAVQARIALMLTLLAEDMAQP